MRPFAVSIAAGRSGLDDVEHDWVTTGAVVVHASLLLLLLLLLLPLLHPLSGLYSRTTWVSPYKKRENQSGFKSGMRRWRSRDAVASAGPYANNLHLAPDRNHTWRPTGSVKALPAVAVKAVCARFFSSTFRDRTRSDLLCVDWNVRPRLESGSLLCTLSSQWTISCDFDDDEAATADDRSTYTKCQSLLEVSVRVASPVAGCKMPSYEIQLTYYWLTYYSLFTTAYTAILHRTRTSYRGR